MRVLSKVMISAAALALAGGLAAAQAAPVVGKLTISSDVELVAGKKKTAKKAGPGSCGPMKYWDRKAKTCADATKKKS
jgi:uncharacterized low-complexity protein